MVRYVDSGVIEDVMMKYHLSRGCLTRPIESPDLLGFLDGVFFRGGYEN